MNHGNLPPAQKNPDEVHYNGYAARLVGAVFEQEMDPAEQERLDKEAEKALAEQNRLIHVEARFLASDICVSIPGYSFGRVA